MLNLIKFIAPTLKAIVGVCVFLVSIGWAAFATISVMVKAEADVVRQEVKHIRDIDMAHLDKRFDKLEVLIKEKR